MKSIASIVRTIAIQLNMKSILFKQKMDASAFILAILIHIVFYLKHQQYKYNEKQRNSNEVDNCSLLPPIIASSSDISHVSSC